MYLKSDDKRVLCDLYRVTYARADQIAELRYPNVDDPTIRLRMGQRRAKGLAKVSYLRRLESPEYRSERRGPAPNIFAVGPSAVPYIAQQLHDDPEEILWQPKQSSERRLLSSPLHALQITDYYVALSRSCREGDASLNTWKSEHELHRYPVKVEIPKPDGGTSKVLFRADAYYELSVGQRRACLFHEHDRATEPMTAEKRRTHWRRKLLCYLALIESGQLLESFDVSNDLWVTIVTTGGEGRVASIKALAEKVAGKDNHSFWITTFDKIEPIRPRKDEPPAIDVLCSPIWQVSGLEGAHAIL